MKSLKRIMEQLNSSTTSSEHHNSTNQIVFDQPFYDDITQARIQHLKLLNLSLKGKKLIDVGSGIGRFSDFFYDQGCEVFCIDGRPENIQTLRSLYPELRAEVVDVESQELLDYGNFDVVFCYGLLYHLSDPFGFIKNAYKICNEMMIIETCITDADDLILRLIPENQTDLSQALHAIGCRPSPSYIITCLKLCGFKYIYTPIELPNHVQFRYQRSNDFSYLKKGHLIRGIFVASHQEIVNEKLQQCS